MEAARRPRRRRGLLPPHPQGRHHPPRDARLLPRLLPGPRRRVEAGPAPAPGREGAAADGPEPGGRGPGPGPGDGDRRARRVVGQPREGDRRLEADAPRRSRVDRGARGAGPALSQDREVERAPRSDEGGRRAPARDRRQGPDCQAARDRRRLPRPAQARRDGDQHLTTPSSSSIPITGARSTSWPPSTSISAAGTTSSGSSPARPSSAGAPTAERVEILREVANLWSERFGNYAQAIRPLERLLELAPRDARRRGPAEGHLHPAPPVAAADRAARPRGRPGLRARPGSSGSPRWRGSPPSGSATTGCRSRSTTGSWPTPRPPRPTPPTRSASLAGLYEREKRWLALAEILRRQRERTDDPAEAVPLLEKLGALFADRIGAPAQAAEALREILDLDPGHGKALRTLRELYAHAADYDGLERLYGSLDQWDELVDALVAIADRMDEQAPRLAVLERAARVAQRLADEDAARGKAPTRGDASDKAARVWERVLTVEPDHADAARALAPIYHPGREVVAPGPGPRDPARPRARRRRPPPHPVRDSDHLRGQAGLAGPGLRLDRARRRSRSRRRGPDHGPAPPGPGARAVARGRGRARPPPRAAEGSGGPAPPPPRAGPDRRRPAPRPRQGARLPAPGPGPRSRGRRRRDPARGAGHPAPRLAGGAGLDPAPRRPRRTRPPGRPPVPGGGRSRRSAWPTSTRRPGPTARSSRSTRPRSARCTPWPRSRSRAATGRGSIRSSTPSCP